MVTWTAQSARTATTTCVTEEPLLNWDRMPFEISCRDGLTRHRINEMLLAAFSLLPSPLSLLPSLSLSLFLLILLPCQECPSWPDWSCFDNFFLLWDWHWWHEGHRTSTWQEAGHMIRTLQNLLSRAGKWLWWCIQATNLFCFHLFSEKNKEPWEY